MFNDIKEILISEDELKEKICKIGTNISRDYKGLNPVFITVLRGSIIFVCDLIREVNIPISLDFLSVSSYSGQSHTGVVRIIKDLDENIENKNVILIEDIIDTGLTLNYIVNMLQERKPASIKVCALLDKKVRRIIEVPIDYKGFEIPDEFVVGYGMDYNQKYRNLPFVGILNEEILKND